MYDKIKADIRGSYYQQQFANDGQRFVAWYVRNIHGQDTNQTKYCITDGADDKQIDAVVIDDEQSAVYIVQGKFHSGSIIDAEPLREVLSSWVQLRDLPKLQENANNKLKQRLSDLSRALEDGYDIHFELIATAELTDAAEKDLAAFQRALAEDESFSASLTLIAPEELQRRYDMALERDNPYLRHALRLEPGKYVDMTVGQTSVVMAAVPLKECLEFPGIKDGSLFQKNVRQSLGLSNSVNKQIKSTIYSDRHRDFFFFHNGITAICSDMSIENGILNMRGLSVVNGCQSLTTILSCSEQVKKLDETYVMFRFYEIKQHDRADKISTSTNSQSTVKPRDLRSNDKRVLALKRALEHRYPDGYLLTKRGEQAPADRNQDRVVDMASLGKHMMSWHSQRPNIAYSETKIFDTYFEQLFKRDYTPEKAIALKEWMDLIMRKWDKDNPLGFNETLLAMKSYAPFHHLLAVSYFFAYSSKQPDRVPAPDVALAKAKESNIYDWIVSLAGKALNMALTNAANEPLAANRVFSPNNWMKAKSSLSGVANVVQTQLMMLPDMGAKDQCAALILPPEAFEYRWQAD
ncbi:AIPR family protein [Lysobacter antibioticus]|nr:AIPR family protein [Lysobacter antibioticus]